MPHRTGRRGARTGRRELRPCRLLLLEAHQTRAYQAIARAAADPHVNCTVKPLRDLDRALARGLPEGVVVGLGPSVAEPIQTARRLRQAGVRGTLVFFGDSEPRLDAIRAELLRDPFACERCELLRLDDPRQLATGLARVAREAGAVGTLARRSTTTTAPRGVSDQFLASILSQANDAIISTDQQGVLLTWNNAAEKLFAYSAEEATGRPIALLDRATTRGRDGAPDADDRPPGLQDMAERVLRTGEPVQGDVTCHRADGQPVDLAVSVAPVRNPQGGLLGLSVIARDNSDQHRAAEALREANRQKDEFLAIMSHELRTPLTSILGYTDMLLRGLAGPLEAKSARYVGNVRNAGDRLLELVNGLLDFTRLEAGREHLELRPINLGKLIRSVVDRLAPSASAKRIQLELRPADNDHDAADRVQGDPDKLQHVLQSFLGNALKFTPEDGRVWVQVGADPERADHVRVSVSDTGIGLRPDQLARVWERFYQADASLTRPYGGMGLGLSIARHLVLLHGGQVGAASPGPGQGSTFWMSLPRA